MYCLKCGKQLPDDATFCSACGCDMSGEHADSPIQTQQLNCPQETMDGDAGTPQKRKSKLITAIVCALAIIPMLFYIVGIDDVGVLWGVTFCAMIICTFFAVKSFAEYKGLPIRGKKNPLSNCSASLNTPYPYETRRQRLEYEIAKQQHRDLKKQARCPKCGSTSLSAHKKGFGVGKAMVGGAVAGPIGLVAGNYKSKKVRVTCMHCGKQFWA